LVKKTKTIPITETTIAKIKAFFIPTVREANVFSEFVESVMPDKYFWGDWKIVWKSQHHKLLYQFKAKELYFRFDL